MKIRATITVQLDGEQDVIDRLATALLIAIPGPVKDAGDVRCVTHITKDFLSDDGGVFTADGIRIAIKAGQA